MPKMKFYSKSRLSQNRKYSYDFTRLCMAVVHGKLKIIEHFYESGFDINQLMDGFSLLHIAIMNNKPEVVKMLLDFGARIPVFNSVKRNPWNSAIYLDRKKIVKLILQSVGYTNIHDENGLTPMHLAAMLNKIHILKTLIKFGAEINEGDNLGNTPLHNATTHGSINGMKLLLDYGANPDYSNLKGNTPLHLAAVMGKENAVKILIQYKGSVNLGNLSLNTPLHIAANGNRWDIIRTLILAGAETDAYNTSGETPLHIAASVNNLLTAQKLIDLGAEVDFRNANGETPLHKAIVCGNMKLVDILIQGTKDLNCCDNRGLPPLGVALLYCRPKVVERLFQAGASIIPFVKPNQLLSHLASKYCRAIFVELYKKLKFESKIKEDGGILTNSSVRENNARLIRRLLRYKVTLSDLLEIAKKFIKYEILYYGEESSMYKIYISEQRFEIYASLLPYLEDCFKELLCMRNKIIHEGITFHHIVIQERDTEEILQQPSLANDYINHILDIQSTKAYPIYRDIIASQIPKVFLREELLRYVFYTRISSRKKVVVDCGSVSVLSEYLPNSDILNLIMAVSNKK